MCLDGEMSIPQVFQQKVTLRVRCAFDILTTYPQIDGPFACDKLSQELQPFVLAVPRILNFQRDAGG